jgi:hypothetical protein
MDLGTQFYAGLPTTGFSAETPPMIGSSVEWLDGRAI